MNEQDRRNKSKKKKVCTDCQKFTWVGVTQDKCERCEKQEPEGAAALSPMANKEEEQQQGGRTRITAMRLTDSWHGRAKSTRKLSIHVL